MTVEYMDIKNSCTEDEAQKRWCPYALTIESRYGVAGNRFLSGSGKLHNTNAVNCIGASCMAWRWHSRPEEEEGRGYCGRISFNQ